MSTSYKYDIAISFLAKDEHIALQLADILDGYSTFIYSKKQEEIAGTDGEISFGEVFGQDARLVVVLYRDGWAKTPWTRIEETAIRNRAYKDGYDFVLFIPLDSNVSMPPWLPKTQLWIGIERWGVDHAASIIDARYQSFGIKPKGSTIEQRADTLAREIETEKYKNVFFGSEPGVKAFEKYFDELCQLLETGTQRITANQQLIVTTERVGSSIIISSETLSLFLQWRNVYVNTLDESKSVASLWRGMPPRHGYVHYETKRALKEISLLPDAISVDQLCWRVRADGTERHLPNPLLSDYLLEWWIRESLVAIKKR